MKPKCAIISLTLMDIEQYRLIYERDQSHWWYVGMNRTVVKLMKLCWDDTIGSEVLDAGCGVGTALTFLPQGQRVTGLDISSEALGYCRQRDYRRLIRGSVDYLPFGDATFDLVLCLDVLYHQAVDDDLTALREFYRVLRPGGRLFVRECAYDWLRGSHGAAVQTRFRYTRSILTSRVAKAGFQLRFVSYANAFLFPLAAAKRVVEQMTGEIVSDLVLPPPPLNQALCGILGLETAILAHTPFPFGLSLLALAEKPIDRATA